MFIVFVVVFAVFFVESSDSQGLQKCECVSRNTCYQPLSNTDGGGLIDIRIVTPNNLTTLPPPSTTGPGFNCAGNTEVCCTGPGVTGCGLRYNIPITSATTPGPNQARYGAYPWQVAVLGTETAPSFIYVGGGALIHPSWVLTAAHKVANRTTQNTIARLGEWRTNSKVEIYPEQDRTITRIIIRPDYNSVNLKNDVALLQLSMPVTIATANPAVNTICIPSPTTNFDNMRCMVAGWGKNAFNGVYQETLKQVEVPVLPNAACQMRLQATRLGPSFLLDPTSFMCAGGESGRDACTGDGGSPLACSINGRYQLAGLVSWGIGCADGTVPGVYVRTNSYISWIRENCQCI